MPFSYRAKAFPFLLFSPIRALQSARLDRRAFHVSITTHNRHHAFDQSWKLKPEARGVDTPWGNGKDTALLRGVLRYVTNQRRADDDIPWEGDLHGKVGSEIQTSLPDAQRGPLADKNEIVAQDTTIQSSDSFHDENGTLEREGGFDTAKPPVASTITRTERMTFEHIFSDISERVERGKSSKAARTSKMSFESASGASPLEPLSTTETEEEIMGAISRYPLSLRAAAARAVGLVNDPRQVQEPTSEANASEKLRQSELKRVEDVMRAASTDVELWQVMEKEVFSLIRRLGLEETPSVGGTKAGRGRRKKEEVKEATSHPSTGENESLDLTIYGSLYPSHLLVGLQLLDLSFAKPSLLALNVLPRIKSLGLISHVLGASTALYNELLRIYCFRYDNYTGAIDLLAEMEQGGLEFDAETLAIVDEMDRVQHSIISGESGPSLQALWSLPEFAPVKFEEWKFKIRLSLDQSG